MSESQKLKIWSGERYDLPDYDRNQDFVEDDFQLRNMHVWGGGLTPWVIKGFITSFVANLDVSTAIANGALFNLTDPSNLRGTLFVGDTTIVPIVTTLNDNTTNYLHIKLDRVTSSSALRTFWDPTANNGLGGEYQQIVDTAEIKEASIVMTNGIPSADPSHILIARIVTAGGTVTNLYDERNLFYRLGKNSLYTGIGSFTSPVYTQGGAGIHNDMTVGGLYNFSTNVSYVAEIDTIGLIDTFQWSDDGGATWNATGVAITGLAQALNHSTAITFGSVTGHEVGDRWSFTATAAPGSSYVFRLASPAEPNPDVIADANAFVGGDKELDNLKECLDFIMSQIKEIKFGTSLTSPWFAPAPSNLAQFGIGLSGGGVISWLCGGAGLDGFMTFTSDLLILMPGTAFTNSIRVVDYPAPAGITFPDGGGVGGDNVAWVDLDPTSSKILTVTVEDSANFQGAPNRVIIARRVANVLYVGI